MSERQRPVHNFIGTDVSEADLAIIARATDRTLFEL